MFVYTPSVGSAYGDMQNLKTGVGFGQLIRNVHRWAAHLMVLVVALHLVRVFYAGAYKKPREFNWVIGVMLLLLTLGFSFTGYLLPVGPARVLGGHRRHGSRALRPARRREAAGPARSAGPQVGQSTLLRFYALHVAVLPMLLALMLMVHIWRVRKDGFAVERTSVGAFAEEATERPARAHAAPAAAAWPRPTPELYGGRVRLLGVVDRESVTEAARPVDDTVFTWPHLLVRHVVVALGTAAVVLGLAVVVQRPAARPREPERHARAGEGAVVLRRAAGAALALRSAGRRHPRPRRGGARAAAAAVHRPQSRHRERATARSRSCCSASLLAIAVVAHGGRHVLPRTRLEVHRAVDPLVHRVLGDHMDDKSRTRFPPRRVEARRRAADRRGGVHGLRSAAPARIRRGRRQDHRRHDLELRRRARAPTSPPGACTSSTRTTTSSRSRRSARTSAATCRSARAPGGSSARATARSTTSPASTSPAPRRGAWTATR